MKKFKRILSLLMIIAMVVPMVITTGITSSAAKTRMQVLSYNGWYTWGCVCSTSSGEFGVDEWPTLITLNADTASSSAVSSVTSSSWYTQSQWGTSLNFTNFSISRIAGNYGSSTKPGGASVSFKCNSSRGGNCYNTLGGLGRFSVCFTSNANVNGFAGMLNNIHYSSNSAACALDPGTAGVSITFYQSGTASNSVYDKFNVYQGTTALVSAGSYSLNTTGATTYRVYLKRTGGSSLYNENGTYSLIINNGSGDTTLKSGITINNNTSLAYAIGSFSPPNMITTDTTFYGVCDFTVLDADSCATDYTFDNFNGIQADHKWDNGVEQPATYTTKAYKVYTCQDSNCTCTYNGDPYGDYQTQNITIQAGDNCTSGGAATVKYNDTKITVTTAPTGVSGSQLLGYYTTDGVKIADSSGKLVKNVSGYTDGTGWSKAQSNTNLVAKFGTGYLVTYYNDNGSDTVATQTTEGYVTQDMTTPIKSQTSLGSTVDLIGWRKGTASTLPEWATNGSAIGSTYFRPGDSVSISGNTSLYAVTSRTDGSGNTQYGYFYAKYDIQGGSWSKTATEQADKYNNQPFGRVNINETLSGYVGGYFDFPTETASANKTGYRFHTSLGQMTLPRYYTADGNGHGVVFDRNNGYGQDIWPRGSSAATFWAVQSLPTYGLSIGSTIRLYAVWDPIITYHSNYGTDYTVQDYDYITQGIYSGGDNPSYGIDKSGFSTKNYTSGHAYYVLGSGDYGYSMYAGIRSYAGRDSLKDDNGNIVKLRPNLEGYSGEVQITNRAGYTLAGWAKTQARANAGTVDFNIKTFYATGSNGYNYLTGTTDRGDKGIELWAVWQENAHYYINYNANGGTGAPDNQEQLQGLTLTLSSTKPTKDGYRFIQWDGSDSNVYQPGDTIPASTTGTITLTAKWTREYTVTFNIGDNVTGGPTSPQKILAGQTLTISGKPTKSGDYNFSHWTCGGEIYKDGWSGTISSDMTFTAVYKTARAIKYNANGGSGAPSDTMKNDGEPFSISSVIPTKDAATFNNWLGSDGNTYKPGDIYNVDSALTLTAQWSAQSTVTLTYSWKRYGSSGSSPAVENCSLPANVVVPVNTTITLGAASQNSTTVYNFTGWSGSDGKTYNAGDSVTLTSNLTLSTTWAKPSATRKTVTINKINCTANPSANTLTTGKGKYVIPLTFQANRGYHMTSLTSIHARVYVNGSATTLNLSISNYDYDKVYVYNCEGVSDKTTFTATATANTYYVQYYTFDSSSSYGSESFTKESSTVDKTYDTAKTMHADPVINGLTFLGWSSSPTSRQVLIPAGSDSSVYDAKLACKNGITYDLYPVFMPNYVTYDNNGGSGAPSSSFFYTSLDIPQATMSKTDCEFLGWSENPGDKTATYTNGQTGITGLSGNVTLYAIWLKKYVITWDFNGGSTTSQESDYTHGSVPYGSTLTAPADPTKTGHTFAGWTEDGITVVSIPSTVPASNKTYIAKWNISKFTVSLTPGDGGQTTITTNPENLKQPFDYNTEVTIKAIPNDGFEFDGWYDSGDNLVYPKTEAEKTFNITSNVVLKAKFVATSTDFILTIIANNPDVTTYTLTDKKTTPGGGIYEYAANTNVTLTFTDTENYDFKYWVNGTGKIMSQNAEYTFVMVGNTELTAVYSKKSEKPTDVQHAMVVYETSYGQVIKSMYCDEYGFFDTTQELRLNVPNTPTRVGYECIGWDQTVTEITTVIKAGVKKMIIIKPLYNYNPETFSVTVNFIDKDTGKALDNVDPITKTTTLGSTFKFTATQKLNDKDFICWKNSEGNIVSYSYNFIVYPKDAEDFVLYACYSSTEEYVPQPKIAMTNTIFEEGSIKGSVKMTFEATRTLPDGYTIVEQGFMVYKGEHTFSDGIIPYDLQTTDDNAMKRVGNINEEGVTLYVLNVGKANVDANKEYNVQGYMWVREPDPEDPNKTVLNRYTTELKKVKSGEVLD